MSIERCKIEDCPVCRGQGKVPVPNAPTFVAGDLTCPHCKGSGVQTRERNPHDRIDSLVALLRQEGIII